ncbi:MAG: hypothetical protein QM785_09050 [Pyrinomonadaceae bacterium]
MTEFNDFYNSGFGWICRHCERDLAATPVDGLARIFREGEAESKEIKLSSQALAKWTDATRRYLTCPRCGITELVDQN